MRRKKGFFTLVTSCEKIFCKNLPQNVQNRMVSIHIYYRGKVPEKNTPTRQNSACAALTTRNMSAVLGLDMPCQKLSLMFRSNYPPVDYRHSLYLFPQPPGGRPRSSGMFRPSRRVEIKRTILTIQLSTTDTLYICFPAARREAAG